MATTSTGDPYCPFCRTPMEYDAERFAVDTWICEECESIVLRPKKGDLWFDTLGIRVSVEI